MTIQSNFCFFFFWLKGVVVLPQKLIMSLSSEAVPMTEDDPVCDESSDAGEYVHVILLLIIYVFIDFKLLV